MLPSTHDSRSSWTQLTPAESETALTEFVKSSVLNKSELACLKKGGKALATDSVVEGVSSPSFVTSTAWLRWPPRVAGRLKTLTSFDAIAPAPTCLGTLLFEPTTGTRSS